MSDEIHNTRSHSASALLAKSIHSEEIIRTTRSVETLFRHIQILHFILQAGPGRTWIYKQEEYIKIYIRIL